jgi:hypothetical protein
MRFAIVYDCPQPPYGQLAQFSSSPPAGEARPVASRASRVQEMRPLARTRGTGLALT